MIHTPGGWGQIGAGPVTRRGSRFAGGCGRFPRVARMAGSYGIDRGCPMPLRSKQKFRLVIATPLEGELVGRIRAVAPQRVEVIHEPELLPAPRFPADHRGDPSFRRAPAAEERWAELIASAHILWDIPPDRPEGGNV